MFHFIAYNNKKSILLGGFTRNGRIQPQSKVLSAQREKSSFLRLQNAPRNQINLTDKKAHLPMVYKKFQSV